MNAIISMSQLQIFCATSSCKTVSAHYSIGKIYVLSCEASMLYFTIGDGNALQIDNLYGSGAHFM